jgi:hypothetical protein
MKRRVTVLADLLAGIAILFSLFAIFLIAPRNVHADGVYNDRYDLTMSHEIADYGLDAYFSEYKIMAPALILYVSIDKKWNGEIRYWGIYILITLSMAGYFLRKFSKKSQSAIVPYLFLSLYLVAAQIYIYQSIIINNWNW